MTDTYKLSDATKQKVLDLFNKKKYPAAYAAIAADLERQQQAGVQIDHDTLAWYADAAQINDQNSKTFLHYFIRDYVSDFSKVTTGKTISDSEFQEVSNDLANDVIKGIVKNGVVPDFNTVGRTDTQNAVDGFKKFGVYVTPYDWPAYAELAAGLSHHFDNPSWLKGLLKNDEHDILKATKEASLDAARQAPSGAISLGNILNFGYLYWKAFEVGQRGDGASPVKRSRAHAVLQHQAAKARAAAAQKSQSAFQQMHQHLLQRAQARFAVAPLKTRLGVAVPVRRQAVGEAEAATASLRARVSSGAAAPPGQVPRGLSLHPVLGTKAKTGAIPWPIAPRGAAAQIAAGLAKRGVLGAPGSLAVMPGGEPEGSTRLPARAAAAGQAVLSPPPAFSRDARRGAMRNAVTLPDGNAVLVPGNYAPDTAAAYMPLHEYEASAQAALDSDWRENFERLMHRESRRPPSGTTGVDWRVAVPWPGLKTL